MAARILIVDDDPKLREMLHALLKEEGYLVAEAEDGMAALNTLGAAHSPVVVLLDLLMPRMNGEEMLRAVARDPALATRHAYILLTAQPDGVSTHLHDQLKQLAIPLIAKPFELDHLMESIAGAAKRINSGHVGS